MMLFTFQRLIERKLFQKPNYNSRKFEFIILSFHLGLFTVNCRDWEYFWPLLKLQVQFDGFCPKYAIFFVILTEMAQVFSGIR